ncbi:MAG: hypothetical protein B7Z16_04305 [Algoriphagus sp. 32-45-6]|nr:MAG: hypothetical protein B7Z16_04305 [Algoriphagus sp. 32-45-6]
MGQQILRNKMTEIVENIESMDSVDLTRISERRVSQLYCSFDVALMQLCCSVDTNVMGKGIGIVFSDILSISS